ncbi:MAG: signal peptide peptidase SppA [Frankia sp.]
MAARLNDVLTTVRDVRADRSAPLVLELDLTADLVEGVPADPVSAVLARRRLTLRTVIDGLRRAGGDDRVGVVLARIGPAGMPLARVQEVRDAVIALRSTGTIAIAYADSFGEFGGGTVPYYLATAFDEIWLAPPGDVGLTGVALETPFVRDALDRLGIRSEIGQRHEYKNAPNTFLERGLTPAHREALTRIAVSSADQIVAGIASARKLPAERVRGLVDAGPLSGPEALAAGLVDRLGYRDEVYAEARARAVVAVGERPETDAGPAAAEIARLEPEGPPDAPDAGPGPGTGRAGPDLDGARLLYLGQYRKTARRHETTSRLSPVRSRASKGDRASTKVVAVIHGTGPVMIGRGGPLTTAGPSMTSDAVTAAFRAATRDDDVAAVVFRVDSPGGSYVASDLIRREVELTRASGRPVVVSMGSVAASGGYFVAMAADAIVAQPGTLTGSIGVFGGKQVVSGLLDRVGINIEAVSEGANALILSPRRAFTDAERGRLEAFLDRVYDDFTAKVAAARGMTRDQVHEIARGRVWTGADARDRGLVDELGGFDRAVELAWEKAGQPATGTPPRLRLVPKLNVADRIRPPRNSEDRAAAAVAAAAARWGSSAGLAGLAGRAVVAGLIGGAGGAGWTGGAGQSGWGPLAALAARAGLPMAGPLLMPPVGLVV